MLHTMGVGSRSSRQIAHRLSLRVVGVGVRRGLIVVFGPTPRYVMGGGADVEDQEIFVCSKSRWVIATEPKVATEVVLFVIREWQAG